ncbi:unnamed protein product [Schistocephalus solidus]|uniref:Uncharacterized protein n=1 Tax=Schistocephalus solidus TaxID=70667 RepID=A0A183SN07_SCHSO|nr:unnamed protein product [Schistocephalus solidus]
MGDLLYVAVDSATSPDVVRYQSNKKSMNRFSSLLSLFNVRQDHKFGSNNFLPETSRNSGSTGKAAAAAKNYGLPAQQQQQQHPQEDRLRRIEEQVGRLSGCFHLCADAVTGSTLGLSSKDYCVQIELQPLCQQQPSRMSLSGAGRRNSLLLPLEHPEGSSPSLTDSSTPFCWSFKLSANKTGFYASTSNVNASVTGYVPPNSTYALSETTHDLSPEPFTAARHWGSVGADDGGELVSPKRQAEAHQAIIATLRQTAQTSHDVIPDGKVDTSVASLCLWSAAPEEGVAGTHLLQLTLLRESGLAESSDVHLVARQFLSD